MLLKSLVPVLAISLYTIGCADSSGGNNTPKSAVPENLGFTKPTPGQKLTETEIKEMESIFADKPMMILPPNELLFPNKEMTNEDIAELENDLLINDSNSYKFYTDIKQNCQISNPEPKVDLNFPLNSEGELDVDKLKAGDSASLTVQKGILATNGCPTFYGIDLSMGVRLDQINLVKDDVKKSSAQLSANLNLKNAMKFLKPEYVDLLKMNGLVVDGNLSSTTVVLNEKLDFIFRTSLSGQYNGIKATIPYSSSLQFLIKGAPVQFDGDSEEQTTGGRVEVVMNTTLKFPKFSVVVDAYLVGVNGADEPSLIEVYLNGHKIEIEEAQKILGSNNPAINVNPKVLTKFKLN